MLRGFLAGNLGRDAELRDVSGTPVCSFSVAVTQRAKDQKITQWVKCSLWGKRGPALASYLTTGQKVAVAGELTVRVYNGKVYLDCRVDDVTLLGSKQGGTTTAKGSADAEPSNGGYGDEDYGPAEGEIPF